MDLTHSTSINHTHLPRTMSSQYRKYAPSTSTVAPRRRPLSTLSTNYPYDEHEDNLVRKSKDVLKSRPTDEDDLYEVPRGNANNRHLLNVNGAGRWDLESVINVPARAELEEYRRVAGRGAGTGDRRMISTSIEDYEIKELLGSGGFGKVYRAVGIGGQFKDKEVAIKMIDKSKTRTPALRRRIANEVEIQCQLSHPSILTLHDYFEDQDGVYMVMELCAGGELYQYLQCRRRPLSEPEARGVMEQLVHGLLYMHKNGILHRDLKLSNVLLTDKFDVVHLDAVRSNTVSDLLPLHRV
ncbi:kinase-like domain-containing protein [Jimgerdemannia flammicorona]|uniref:Kinase-like domain-containing protein n=1 Tax=Jimgerdemannia flammicorona TaxID=994334 RepID=A0A433QI62_9FUNG|nr:kinase-like domain-containing protein [Jimgerdemannia flammicorona]